MYDPDFLNPRGWTCKGQSKPTGPWSEESTQTDWDQGEPVGSACPEPGALNLEDRDGEMGKEGVLIQEAHVLSVVFAFKRTNLA